MPEVTNFTLFDNLIFLVPIYKGYSAMYGCNLKEIAEPLDSFENFRAFFTRKLKEGARPIDPSDIVSPVDARVLNFGQVHSDTLEQVKGIDYSLFAFFGKKYEELERLVVEGDILHPPTKLYHCIFYLAPGDYHGFHSPADWTIQLRRHFPGMKKAFSISMLIVQKGYLFPVAPISTNYVHGLFSLNERVVLFGKWKYGFFSYTPVGATNVGSILLNFDHVRKTMIIKVILNRICKLTNCLDLVRNSLTCLLQMRKVKVSWSRKGNHWDASKLDQR